MVIRMGALMLPFFTENDRCYTVPFSNEEMVMDAGMGCLGIPFSNSKGPEPVESLLQQFLLR